jgi:hypothetical protein
MRLYGTWCVRGRLCNMGINAKWHFKSAIMLVDAKSMSMPCKS